MRPGGAAHVKKSVALHVPVFASLTTQGLDKR
jgi:hypothetical protein